MAISLDHDSTGSVVSHFVTYLTVVIIYRSHVHLAGIKNGPMKSIAQISNVKLGFTDIKGIYVLVRGRPIRWNRSHLFMDSLQS